VAAVRERFEAVYPADALHMAGLPAVIGEVLRQTILAFTFTTPLVALVLLATVWLFFGRLWPASISLSVAAVAVVWSLGFAVAIAPQLHVLMGAVPGVILIIAFSDGVHLCSAFLLELGEGLGKEEAVLTAGSEVGRACLFTSLTTFVGFVCLSLVPVPAFRVLGVVLGFGVAAALLLAVTLVPILLSLLPAPKPRRRGVAGRAQAAADRALRLAERLATRRPGLVIAGFALLTAAALAGAARLEIETDLTARLARGNPVRDDADWFAERFRGTNVVQVYVTAPDPGALEDPAWLSRVAGLEDAVVDLEAVDAATSWVDVLSAVHRATPAGRDGPPRALPEAPAVVRTISGLVRQGAGPDADRLVDADAGRLRILVAIDPRGMRDTADVADRVEALAWERFDDGTAVLATGLTAHLGHAAAAEVAGGAPEALEHAALHGVRGAKCGVYRCERMHSASTGRFAWRPPLGWAFELSCPDDGTYWRASPESRRRAAEALTDLLGGSPPDPDDRAALLRHLLGAVASP